SRPPERFAAWQGAGFDGFDRDERATHHPAPRALTMTSVDTDHAPEDRLPGQDEVCHDERVIERLLRVEAFLHRLEPEPQTRGAAEGGSRGPAARRAESRARRRPPASTQSTCSV